MPPGRWVEWFGGAVHSGPALFRRNYTQDEIPLLVKAGAIIPMKGLEAAKQIAPERLLLEVVWVAGAAAGAGTTTTTSGELYEDGGDDLLYQQGAAYYCLTNLSLAIGAAETTLAISAGGGGGLATQDTATHVALGLPARRRFEVRFRGAPASAAGWRFSPASAALGSSWWWEDGVGGRTLVGVTALVDSGSAVSASFSH